MKYFFTIALLLLFMTSCSKNEVPLVKSDAEEIADSLQAVADSLAMLRELHSQQSRGGHIHAPGSDLAAAAHQDPVKMRRLRQTMRDQAPARRAAAAARSRAVTQSRRENHNNFSSSDFLNIGDTTISE